MLILRVPSSSSPAKGLYNPKAFVTHAASLDQACAHCPRFPTAASRRSLGRVSVPVWPATLSGRLRIVALVGRYPTNKLIRRGPIPRRQVFPPQGISGISRSFPRLSRTSGQVPTRYSPVRHSPAETGASDLHVLSAPPAFVLSQDQTLSFILDPPRAPRLRGAPGQSSGANGPQIADDHPNPNLAARPDAAPDNPLTGCTRQRHTPPPAHPFHPNNHVQRASRRRRRHPGLRPGIPTTTLGDNPAADPTAGPPI